MSVEIRVVLSQNITLLYDSLELQTINTGELKKLMGSEAKPMIMDTPEMIVAVYPDQVLVIQMGDRRIRITFQQQNDDIGSVPLWETAVKCDELIAESQSKLVAYGFNYDVGVELTDQDANKAILNLFILNPEMIENALEGHLLTFVPRLLFKRNQTRYDLVLEPGAGQRMKVHLNTHFEFEGITLPPHDQLEASFREEFRYLVSMLPGLLDGGK